MKPETQNWRLEPTGLDKPRETRRSTGMGPGVARQESAVWVFRRFWNRTDPFLQSKPEPLAGYPDPLLTLTLSNYNFYNHVPEVCAESYTVGYMNAYGMAIIIVTDSS